tara:strand:+ start:31086 stop:33266 length:2181 start_codon:yes stop_codon:yes gene_type:complete
MRTFITTILSLLLLVTFVAPVVIDGTSADVGIAFAQEVGTEGLVDDNGSRFLGEKALTGVLQSVAALFLQMGATFLWLAGALFNFGIKYSIIEFASFANIAGIPIAWTVLRDITNVFFIFVFLAIGIGTILNLQQYGVKKLLPVLLAVAVLINFSLFFTKVTIDVAHGFAGAILNQSGVVVAECNSEGDCAISQGVATAFMEQLGVVNIFGTSVDTTLGPDERDQPIFTGDKVSDGFSALLFGFFGFIFLSAAAIVFLAGAVLLIMRIVKLLLLMIASAPAMAAYVLPNTRPYFNKWLEELTKEAFFAPILLLLFSISLLFLNTARGAFVDGDQSFAEIFVNGNLDSINIVVLFLIALGLLFMSIKAASDMGVSGAKMASNVQNWGTRRLSSATLGGAAALGRQTIGQGAAVVGKRLERTAFARTGVGRVALTGVRGAANANYDPREFGDANVLGKPGKGFVGRADDAKKEKLAYAGTLKLSKEEEERKTELEGKAREQKDLVDERKEQLKKYEKDLADAKAKRIEAEAKIAEAERAGDFKTRSEQMRVKSVYEMGEAEAQKAIENVKAQVAGTEEVKKQLDTEVAAAAKAPQLEYAENLVKDSSIGTKVAFDKPADETHYRKLEAELAGLRKDLREATDADRNLIMTALAEKNSELTEHMKKSRNIETSVLSNVALATGGLAATAKGNIEAAEQLRNEAFKTKDKDAKDRDALAKAVKDAVKDSK